jgi:hypothetical protein
VSDIASKSAVAEKNLVSTQTPQTLSFNEFNTLYRQKYNTTLDPDWLGWFVGFAEGDGYLGINKDIIVFVLTQKEAKILYEVRDTLKFGYVKEFEGVYRYIVRNQSDMLLLFHLFNGNLHFLAKIDQLVAWEKLLNSKNKGDQVKAITKPVKLSLNNSWFSGFVDAEGCFNAYVAKNDKTVSLRFIVDQKDGTLFFNDLKHILNRGSIYSRKNNNARYAVSNFTSLSLILNYFNQFTLRTKKRLAFVKWVNIYNCVLNKEHKSPEGIAKIKVLCKLVNQDND